MTKVTAVEGITRIRLTPCSIYITHATHSHTRMLVLVLVTVDDDDEAIELPPVAQNAGKFKFELGSCSFVRARLADASLSLLCSDVLHNRIAA